MAAKSFQGETNQFWILDLRPKFGWLQNPKLALSVFHRSIFVELEWSAIQQ